MVAIVGGIVANGQNVAFLVALAFAVAASANLPTILYSLFWARFNTTGALCSIYGGLVTSVVLIVFSPAVSGKPVNPATGRSASMLQGVDFHWFPLDNPGLVSIPLSFLLGAVGTLLGGRRPDAARRYAEMEVRALTGAGAERATVPEAADGRADAFVRGPAQHALCGPCKHQSNRPPAHGTERPWQDRAMNGVPTVAVADVPADAPLLDVREADEWAAGHAPTARHLPMSELVDADRRAARRRPALRRLPLRRPLGAGRGLPRRAGLPRGERRRRHAGVVRPGPRRWSPTPAHRRSSSRPRRVRPPGCRAPAAGTCPTPPGAPSARTAGATSPRCSGWPSPRVDRRPSSRCRGRPATSVRRATPSRRAGASRPAPWAAARRPRAPAPTGADGARSLAAVAVPLLWALAAVALLAAGAEIWRYVAAAGQPGRRAVGRRRGGVRRAGARGRRGCGPARPRGGRVRGRAGRCGRGRGRGPQRVAAVAVVARVVLGWVVPGLNLAVPGPVLAEIEHGALDRPPDRRPQPSRLVRGWWLLWVAAACSRSIVTLVWSWRTGVQAGRTGSCCTPCWTCSSRSRRATTAVVVAW